jgi:adhesin/invasin
LNGNPADQAEVMFNPKQGRFASGVTDAAGNRVPGVVVTFSVITAGAQISNGTTTGTTLTVTTNATGIAALASWTLGAIAQPYTLNATATGLTGSPVVFTATAVPGTGTVLAFVTPPSATASSGAPLSQQPVIQLKDAQGNNITTAGIVITAGIATGAGTLTNATATTVAGGTATFSGLTITGTVGSFTLSFSAPGYTPLVSGTIALGAGTASTIALNAGNNQTATVATNVAIPPSVKVTDASGNSVAGVVVTFGVVTAGAQISNGTTTGTTLTVTTNASGIAALTAWTLGAIAQPYTLNATATGLNGSPVVFTATAVPGVGTQLVFVTPPPATALSGAPLSQQPVIQLKDAQGNNITTAGVAITACGRSGIAVSSARSERISSLCPASTLSLFWMDCVESIA